MNNEDVFCNRCGKKMDIWDKQQGFHVDTRLGYGSFYDEDRLVLNLCSSCIDSLIDMCVIMPVEEGAA